MNVFVKASLPALAGASFLLASSAMAQGTGAIGPTTGDREFSISGTGSSNKDFDNGSFGVSGDYGWYLSDQTLVGIRQSVNFADTAGDSDNMWNGSTRGFADYHFGQGAARPFVGASLGGIYGDAVKDTGIAGLETGLKYYMLPSTFVQGRAEYQFLFDDSNSAQDNYDNGVWAYTIGMGINF